MIYVLIAVTSCLASFLTFFSGFGLGTILLPVFAIYYPLPLAVALTACVHLLNNVFKLMLVYKGINWRIVLKFGIPSLIAAFFGAWLLKSIDQSKVIIASYALGNSEFIITLPGFLIGMLVILFAIIELMPRFSTISFSEKYLIHGGLLSGFFGGFSGHQGSIRSAFLLRLKLEKTAFIATGVFIACMVDMVRISLYTSFSELKSGQSDFKLLLLAVISAWVGALAGNKLFTKTSILFFKWFVGIFMLLMGFLIMTGII